MRSKSREYSYITNSREITIKVKKFPNSVKGISVSAYYNDKMALVAPFKAYILTEEKSEQFVNEFCDMLGTFTNNDIQEHAEADRIMFALNVKNNLKEVRNKNGRTIWRKR